MNYRFLSLVLFIALSFSALAQSAKNSLKEATPATVGMSAQQLGLLDGHIQKYIGEGTMPGGVFLIARKGKIVYFKNFGHTALDKKETYQKDDIFRLASMTKAVTTVSIMQLLSLIHI